MPCIAVVVCVCVCVCVCVILSVRSFLPPTSGGHIHTHRRTIEVTTQTMVNECCCVAAPPTRNGLRVDSTPLNTLTHVTSASASPSPLKPSPAPACAAQTPELTNAHKPIAACIAATPPTMKCELQSSAVDSSKRGAATPMSSVSRATEAPSSQVRVCVYAAKPALQFFCC